MESELVTYGMEFLLGEVWAEVLINATTATKSLTDQFGIGGFLLNRNQR